MRFWVFVLRPFVYLGALFRQRRMILRVNAMLEEVSKCDRRDALEGLLGSPLYAVDGESAGARLKKGGGFPERIECYEADGCCIDLWFKNGRRVDLSGFIKPTLWDMALIRGWTEPDSEVNLEEDEEDEDNEDRPAEDADR